MNERHQSVSFHLDFSENENYSVFITEFYDRSIHTRYYTADKYSALTGGGPLNPGNLFDFSYSWHYTDEQEGLAGRILMPQFPVLKTVGMGGSTNGFSAALS